MGFGIAPRPAEPALYQACIDHHVGLIAMKPYHGGTLFWVNGPPSGITPARGGVNFRPGLGLKRLPAHGFPAGFVAVMQGDFLANLRTLVRFVQQAATLRLT
jgi:hypothetical protein